MDFRKVFDSVPEEFERWRFRYCDELFADVAGYAGLGPDRAVLEIGPGTGQATGPILATGCDYLGVELGENFTASMRERFGDRPNFRIVNDDFVTCDLGGNRFDLVYSAATIQWIPEEIAFPKAHHILKDGGALAMFFTSSDYKTPNEALYGEIQRVYDDFFHPETPYTCKMEYKNVVNYGFVGLERREYPQTVEYTADDYVSMIAIHADHLTLREPERSRFFNGIRKVILRYGGRITLNNTITLYLARKV